MLFLLDSWLEQGSRTGQQDRQQDRTAGQEQGNKKPAALLGQQVTGSRLQGTSSTRSKAHPRNARAALYMSAPALPCLASVRR